jgi:hypothetical protein
VWRRRAIWAAVAVALLIAFTAGAGAEIAQQGNLRVAFSADLAPLKLPRRQLAPVAVSFAGHVTTTDGTAPAQLQQIAIEINRHGRLDRAGLPVCHLDQIQPSTDLAALAVCRGALVGEGRFSARVLLAEQAPFPSRGRVLAFNAMIGCSELSAEDRSVIGPPDFLQEGRFDALQEGRFDAPLPQSVPGRGWPSRSRTQGGRQGERTQVRDPQAADRGRRDTKCHPRPGILAHVYGTEPAPTSYTIPFLISRAGGEFATRLSASLPEVTSESGYVTGLAIKLERSFTYRGVRHSYLEASCPAPPGFPGAVFSLARASFAFGGGATLGSTLTRSCSVRAESRSAG